LVCDLFTGNYLLLFVKYRNLSHLPEQRYPLSAENKAISVWRISKILTGKFIGEYYIRALETTN